MSRISRFLLARFRPILFLALLLVGLFSLAGYNNSRRTALVASLTGGTPQARDAAVRGLIANGHLVETLLSTESPLEDLTSPANQRSLRIRKNAVESVNRLTSTGQITTSESLETLFSLCKDIDYDAKTAAENGLATLGRQSDSNLSAIVKRLSDGDPDLRGAAGDVLGLISGDKAAALVNAVLPAVDSHDAALVALQKIGAPSVPLVVAHLEDPAMQGDILFRQQMVGILDQIAVTNLVASPASFPELKKIAELPGQPSVQRLAQVALADTVLAASLAVRTAKSGPAAAAAQAAMTAARGAEPTLRGILSDTQAAGESRAQAALALGQYADAPAIATLAAGLGDFDAQVRDAAETGLQASGAPAVAPLTQVLVQGSALARVGAAQALGGIGTPAAVTALLAAFQSTSSHGTLAPEAVREGVIVGLGRTGSLAVIPTLVQALGDQNGAVAAAAQQGLLNPALERPAIPLLIAALSSPTPIPFNASQTLSHMGAVAQAEVVPRLTQGIGTATPAAQTWAAVTLGEIGSATAPVLTALKGLSKSADPHVQYAASQSLLKLAGAG